MTASADEQFADHPALNLLARHDTGNTDFTLGLGVRDDGQLSWCVTVMDGDTEIERVFCTLRQAMDCAFDSDQPGMKEHTRLTCGRLRMRLKGRMPEQERQRTQASLDRLRAELNAARQQEPAAS